MVFMFLVVTVLSIHARVVSCSNKTLYIFSLKKWDKTTNKLKGWLFFFATL
jgi:hypothetical protein